VPTQNDILVPETLLKKRKSQEKAREERALATKEKRGKTHRPATIDRESHCDDYNYHTIG
jgi:large subunit ribosomal protein L7e